MIAHSVWTKHKNRSPSHDIFNSSVRVKKKCTGWIPTTAFTKGCSMMIFARLSDYVMVKPARTKRQNKNTVWSQLSCRVRETRTLIEFINKGLINGNWFCDMPNLYHDWLSYSSPVFIREEGKGYELRMTRKRIVGNTVIAFSFSRKTERIHGTNSVIE